MHPRNTRFRHEAGEAFAAMRALHPFAHCSSAQIRKAISEQSQWHIQERDIDGWLWKSAAVPKFPIQKKWYGVLRLRRAVCLPDAVANLAYTHGAKCVRCGRLTKNVFDDDFRSIVNGVPCWLCVARTGAALGRAYRWESHGKSIIALANKTRRDGKTAADLGDANWLLAAEYRIWKKSGRLRRLLEGTK